MTKDQPVFFDDSGKRWHTIKVISLLLAMVTGNILYDLAPKVLANPVVPSPSGSHYTGIPSLIVREAKVTSKTPIETLAKDIGKINIPVIGAGAFVRVISVENVNGRLVAADPFDGHAIGYLSESEAAAVRKNTYAIQQYNPISPKTLSLTFDDGPHPLYTPQILDILSREHVQATFFVTGSSAIKHPDIIKRIVREGHNLGNHTFTHADLDYVSAFRSTQELTQTQRIIRATSSYNTGYFRHPYGGNTSQSYRDDVLSILRAQHAGYQVVGYDFDSNDWQFDAGYNPKLPGLNGAGYVILLHDSGGPREHTIAYLETLIRDAKEAGYAFTDLEGVTARPAALFQQITPDAADKMSVGLASFVLVWPERMIKQLFVVTASIIFIVMFGNVLLAYLHLHKRKFKRRAAHYNPNVTVIIPAYNEARVLEGTIASLLHSRYKNLELLIVDDGSMDETLKVARRLAQKYPRVRALHQRNKGKSAALNYGIKKARGDILINVDADTVFARNTITKLTRHFYDPAVGAVAGMVKVGNIRGALARWQALEYIISINIDRNAQGFLNGIVIVPGACGAWRKQAILACGGYSSATLAEDCDLTISLHELGYKVLQDNEAISYTEVPTRLQDYVKQRFRWTFGNLQSFWKHKNLLFKSQHGWLGMYVLPSALLSTLMPMIFYPLLMLVAIENVIAGRYLLMLIFAVSMLVLQLLFATLGILLARERLKYLLITPYSKIIQGPIRTYLLFRTLLTALKGRRVGWNKLARSGSLARMSLAILRQRT